MLPDQPAEGSDARIALRQPVAAFRQRPGKLRQAPGRERLGILDRGDDVEALCAVAGQDGELVGILAVEAQSGEQGATAGGLLLEPGLEAILVDQVDGMGRPAAVWLQERSEIGHQCAL